METEYQLVVYLEFLNRVKYTLLQKSKQPGTKKEDAAWLTTRVELDFMSTKKNRLFDTAFLVEKLIFKNRSQEHNSGDNSIS